MKKIVITAAVLLCSGALFAQYIGESPQECTMTTQQLKNSADTTGEINVNIDPHRLSQAKLGTYTRVFLTGKLDKEWNKPTEFKVKKIHASPSAESQLYGYFFREKTQTFVINTDF